MAKYYTIKLTEAQYNHVLDTMDNAYGDVIHDSETCHIGEYDRTKFYKNRVKLHEQTEEALMAAQEKK